VIPDPQYTYEYCSSNVEYLLVLCTSQENHIKDVTVHFLFRELANWS
jgi:hypothetical protein